ncbi:MAG TPA: hypothetical protein VKM55_04440 [Candidatus Lokiarchaeia archaeon]|nr:hypothetical protein [Candidatus Lokiarchaeia archaeon]
MLEQSNSDIPPNIKETISSRKFKIQKGRFIESTINLILAYIILLFSIFGYIANTWFRAADGELLFLWRYFNPVNWANDPSQLVPFICFAVTIIILGYTENVYLYAARKTVFLIIFLIVTAIIFHQILHPSISSGIVFFTSVEGYSTIGILGLAGLFFSWVGNQLHLVNYRRKKREIEYINKLQSLDRN